MDDGVALLRAILEQPDDDTPRLAYADWLQENGQAERAAFIRDQTTVAHPEPRQHAPGCPLRGLWQQPHARGSGDTIVCARCRWQRAKIEVAEATRTGSDLVVPRLPIAQRNYRIGVDVFACRVYCLLTHATREQRCVTREE